MQKKPDTYKKTYVDGIALGAFIASLIFLVLFCFLDFGIGEHWISFANTTLVITGTMAAALLALRGIRLQVQSNFDQLESRRQGSLAASNAVLPLALSEITRVCRHNIRRHFIADDLEIGATDIVLNDVAELSSSAINVLKDCIEFADDETRDRLANLVRTYQVLTSRAESGYEDKIETGISNWNQSSQLNEVTNWSALHALADDMYDYSRGRSDTIPKLLDNDRVYTALNSSGVSIDNYPKLAELFEHRANTGGFDIMSRS